MTQLSSTPFSTSHPMTFARGRYGDMYGINGEDRGFRWDCITANVEAIGIVAPASGPSLTADTNSPEYYVSSIHVLDPGYGYLTPPDVTITGGTPSTAAEAKATIRNSRVASVQVLKYGSGYASAPTVSVDDPTGTSTAGSGATFTVTATGSVTDILPTNFGTGYTSAPTVSVSGGSPTTPAVLRASINDDGEVDSVQIVNPGEGYTSAPTVAFSGGGGSGAAGTAVLRMSVDSIAVTAAGSGYTSGDILQITGDGGGAYAEFTLTSSGGIDAVNVLAGGAYRSTPTCTVRTRPQEQPRPAKLSAVSTPAIAGKYWAAIRYVDDTPPDRGGPIPSSISELVSIEVPDAAGHIDWSWSNTGMDSRVNKIELWRTTSDQALVLYRVAVLDKTETSFEDTTGDNDLIDPDREYDGSPVFGVLPIVLPNGQVNARRFHPPPRNKRVITMFQDRAWYGVDVPGKKYDGSSDANAAEPNALYFSEVDEPESVPETNQVVIQDNVKGQDKITALMPFGGGMVVFQTRHAYRMSYAAQPVIDASVQLITQRGCLNQRCWDVHEGVAYVADSMGMYILDGTQVQPISDAVETFWSDGGIDFSQSKWFFVRVDPATKAVRFFYTPSGGFPDRALCYHPITQAWWVESYAQTFAAGECLESGGRQRLVAGAASGDILAFDSGSQDIQADGGASSIACTLQTGNSALNADKDRSFRLMYSPTSTDCDLTVALHYNNSATARTAAVAVSTGSGFVTTGGGNASLNLNSARSPLGDATGYAVAHYSGRLDDRSVGGDRHLAIALSATAPASERVLLYGIAMGGVG